MKKIFLFFMAFSFAFLVQAQNKDIALAKELVAKNSAAIGMSPNDLQNYIVSNAYNNEGTDLVYLNQSFRDLPVLNQMRVLAFKNGAVVSSSGGFIQDIQKIGGNTAVPYLRAASAVTAAFSEVRLAAPGTLRAYNIEENGRKLDFGVNASVSENVKAELLWVPVEQNGKITSVKLAWQVQVVPANSADWWLIFVDAASGSVIRKMNLNVADKFDDKHTTGAGILASDSRLNGKGGSLNASSLSNSPAQNFSPSLVGTANYLVSPYPAESPKHPGGAAAIRTNPWTMSPGNATSLGWHNDGTTDYIISRGNNVWATEDRTGTNNGGTVTPTGAPATSTTSPDPLNFNFPPNYNIDPTTPSFQQFAITNLFYWNNLIHDLSYQYGFTEPARNFQANNQGRGGAQGDYVIAIAQSAAGTNNANFATPADGGRPRMRMYLFDPVSSTTLHVNAPTPIVGDYTAVESNFSSANLLENVGPVTGAVAYYDDGTASHEACSGAPANNIAGKIVLIDRGNCNFTVKVLNAQAAGAIAVIVINNVAGAPIIMGGGPDNTIVIPAVMVSQADGAILVANVNNGLNITLSGSSGQNIDGDLDAGVMCHEYFHGISNRLTGNGSTCLQNAEEGGEGWSDYNGLMMTTNWATATTNDGTISRPIGNYVVFNSATGPGIRNYPYSTNIAVNPLTYANMGTGVIGTEVHNIGEIWCMALWEMTWGIIQSENSINTNLFNYSATSTGGNTIAYKLVLEGMKLQPCSPGYIDGRNAILAADRNFYAGRHACAIWTAFAKRGMGYTAAQGSSNSATDQTASTTLPPAPTVTGQPASVSVAAGANVTFTANAGTDVNLIYRWQVSTNGGTTYTDVVPAVITPTLTLTAVTAAMNGYKYRAIVSIGCLTTTTGVATLTVTGGATTPSITLSSAAATTSQIVCINTPITAITYTVGGGATGATVTGLPAGVTGTFAGSTFTISGTPTIAGTFTYMITTTGGTGTPATASGMITVNPNVTLTLTSAAATTAQTVTVNTPIVNITYSSANGATGVTVTGLPAGVTGVYSGGTNGTLTISGTPTVTGTFNYSVVTAGGCSSNTLGGSITVNAVPVGPSVTLTSAAGTNAQTVCVNTPITNITYSTAGGVTGATVTNLPAGVTGVYSGGTNGTVTISGTPTASGPFTYTVTTSGGGNAATVTGSITVTPAKAITLTSAAGTNAQNVTLGSAITMITYSTSGGVTGATVTGLPAGVTGTYSGGTNGTVTISGTPTAVGLSTYTITLTGSTCGTNSVTGTINVQSGPAVTLSSAAGTNAQAVCVNTAITPITYTTSGGVTGATVTGLPAGVTGVYSGGTNGTVTISGTPTTVGGPTTYTVTTTGGGNASTATGTITANGNSTVTISSGAGSNNQTVCANTPITNITYTTTGGVTGATFNTLPAGVTGIFSGSVITISGTPTNTGTFNYTFTTTGGCGTANGGGTITVNPGVTVTLSSAAGTNNQTRCINTAITPITYTSTGGVTNMSVAGLPAGVTGTYSGGTNGGFTISGTPTATGTFNYIVTSAGGCAPVTATGTIIVSPAATITLSSTAGSNNQTVCASTAIAAITYTTGAGVTGATISAGTLPPGVTGTFSGSTFTISGTPTTAGTFNYTVSATGGCGTASANGSITVNPATTLTLTSAGTTNNQTICNSTPLIPIVYTTANGATGATATGLPAGVTGTYAAGVFTITGTPTTAGVFNYTVTTSGGCGTATLSGTITTGGAPVITAQPQNISTCSTTATFSVSATGAGLTYQWQVSTNGGATYTNLPGQTGSTLTLTGLTAAQAANRYRVVITGGCGSVTSNSVTAQVGTPPSVVLTASPSTVYNPSIQGGLYVTVSPAGNYIYQWKRNGQIIPDVLGPSLTAANGLLYDFGTYQVTVFDISTGCFGVSNSVTLTDDGGKRNHLFISPNPTRNIIHISYYSSTTDARVKLVTVYDSKGARVMMKEFNVSGTYGAMDMDLSRMVNGTYTIVLRDASGKQLGAGNVIKE